MNNNKYQEKILKYMRHVNNYYLKHLIGYHVTGIRAPVCGR
jgi:hypothetical protein